MKPRLLIVDDEKDIRRLLSRMLVADGFEVAQAAHGEAALRALEEAPFDVVLLDVMMPVMDGMEVLRHIRERWTPSRLPVVMVTALSDSDDVVRALEAGASDYVTKPLDFAVVIARVRTQVARKLAEDELARALERTRMILDSTGDAVLGVGSDGACTFANPAAHGMLGREVLVGAGLHAVLHGEACACSFGEVLLGRHGRRSGDTWVVRGEEAPLPAGTVAYVCDPVRDGGGMVVTLRDVTEKRDLQRLKDEFVRVVRERVHMPLSDLGSVLRSVDAERLGPSGRPVLEDAVARTRELTAMVNDMLELQVLAAGQAVYRRERCDAAQVVRRAVEAVPGRADVTVVAEPRQVGFMGDPDRVASVLEHLLENALRASPSGGTVTVRAEPRGVGSGEVLFQVIDEGSGIPAEQQASAFERFQGGWKRLGIGLAMARMMVEQQGGRIRLDSTEGRGTMVSFTMPVR